MSEVTNGQKGRPENRDDRKADTSAVRDMSLKLVQECQLMHNIKGLAPVETVYNLIPTDLEKIIFDMASTLLDGIDCVTLELLKNGNTPTLIPYVWLPRDSKHLIDKSANEPGMVINPRVSAYSEKLKIFADNFAPDRDEKGKKIDRSRRIQLVKPRFGSTNLIAVRCDITKFLIRLFDADNLSFRETFAKGNGRVSIRPVEISAKIISRNKDFPQDIRDVLCLRVTKRYADNRNNRNRPIVGSFQERRNRDDDDD